MIGLRRLKLHTVDCSGAYVVQEQYGEMGLQKRSCGTSSRRIEKIGNPEDRPSRFAKVMRPILPCRWRRVGTDSIPAGARIGTNDRALLGMQTTIPAGRE